MPKLAEKLREILTFLGGKEASPALVGEIPGDSESWGLYNR